MRTHTTSGTGRVVALAPEPTAAWFVGNLIRGSAPASGTGAKLLAGVVACVADGAFVRDAVAVVGAGVEGVALALGVLDVDLAARAERLSVLAPGEPALQATRARLVTATAMVAARAVLLRRIVRSLRRASGEPSLPLEPRREPVFRFGLHVPRSCPPRF
ncbi:MAG TPA: hypothetical protein VIJ07_16765 [Dermatophilaceae bacterium]